MSPKVADEANYGSQKSIADITHMSRRVWRMNGCEIFSLRLFSSASAILLFSAAVASIVIWHPCYYLNLQNLPDTDEAGKDVISVLSDLLLIYPTSGNSWI